jgi:hypothetical protein
LKKTTVLLSLEGTYPFNFGGVSTWAHDLCQKVDNTEFVLYSINAGIEQTPKYDLGANIKKNHSSTHVVS